MNLTVYTDGASRGNPGKSGAGALILDDRKQEVASLKEYLGIATNNEAEYKALIVALEYLSAMPNAAVIGEILFMLDSQLLVFQMSGRYSVKSPNIIPLYNKAKTLLNNIKAVKRFRHIPRVQNKEADRLANLAIDEACGESYEAE